MTPLHRRTENALTELARVDALAVQGYDWRTIAARHRAARDELEAILREAGVIPTTAVREHWLDQVAPADATVVNLAAVKQARAVARVLGT